MKDCLIVIPCLRESERVPQFLEELCSLISKSEFYVDLQLVDDGSGREEAKRLQQVVAERQGAYPFLHDVLALDENRGKGGAVRSGWAGRSDEFRLFGFLDADGAVDAEEAIRLLGIALDGKRSMVIASRRVSDARARRDPLRGFVASSFNMMVRTRYGVEVSDTQCGCKYLPADWYRSNEDRFREEEFGFDLELILRAMETELPIQEVGIRWSEEGGSKVSVKACWKLGKKVLLRRVGKG